MRSFAITIVFCFSFALSYSQRFDPNFKLQAGIGIARVSPSPDRPLRFYSKPDFDSVPYQFKAIDSVTFIKGEHYIDIATAPPWLAPEYIKLDYDQFLFRVVTYSQNWIEVIVNNMNGQTFWVDAQAVEYEDWGTFLTGVVAVEVLDADKNPIRGKALDQASIIASVQGAQLRPVAVKGDWLMVSTVGLADRIVPTGWIRWKKGDQLLISYSVLS
ncbi:MAG: hypothetical protein AB7O48_02860 [Cyclobacteriaceae bacterium]